MAGERDVFVRIVADTRAFEAALRKAAEAVNRFARSLLSWDSPANPYRNWPLCDVDHERGFTAFPESPCPRCGAAL